MALGDAEHPISLLFETRVQGEHVHVTVRAGQRGMRAMAGDFTLRQDEWTLLRNALKRCPDADSRIATVLREAGPGGVNPHLAGVRLVHFDADPIEITETHVADQDAEMFARLDEVRARILAEIPEAFGFSPDEWAMIGPVAPTVNAADAERERRELLAERVLRRKDDREA